MKLDRQKVIFRIIEENEVETQKELIDLLKREGVCATQATISRDMREMGITKAPGSGGKIIYVSAKKYRRPGGDDEKYLRVLKDGFASMDAAENILVIRTVSGMAMAVAAALDALSFPELVGTIAGDDTIMCAIRSKAAVREVMKMLETLIAADDT